MAKGPRWLFPKRSQPRLTRQARKASWLTSTTCLVFPCKKLCAREVAVGSGLPGDGSINECRTGGSRPIAKFGWAVCGSLEKPMLAVVLVQREQELCLRWICKG